MAHEVETMAYAGETPWHGLGKRVIADLTPDQMLKEAGLDWEVDKIPAYADVRGKSVYVGKDALVRSSDGRVLDVVSGDWNPVQNSQAFEFFHDFVMAGDMEMHTAGSLKNGQMVWALAKVKESFELFGGDTVESYLLFSNPHQYGKSIDIRFTPIRVVCNNTLTLSLNSKSDMMIRLSHRREFDGDLVKKTMGLAHEKLGTYKEMADFLGKRRATTDKVKEYFGEVFPALSSKSENVESRAARRAFEVLETQPGHKFAEGSWWSAFNATTFLMDHELGHTRESRLASSWYGSNRNRKVLALEKAVEYAEAA